MFSACVGVPAWQNKNAGGISASAQGIDLENENGTRFAGLPRDVILVRYGKPNATLRLDNGFRAMEYRARETYISVDNTRTYRSCIARFWYKTTTILHATFEGDTGACEYFLKSGNRAFRFDGRRNY